jgi:hypothetical protein
VIRASDNIATAVAEAHHTTQPVAQVLSERKEVTPHDAAELRLNRIHPHHADGMLFEPASPPHEEACP